MVGSKGKGPRSRSKSKGLAPEPVEWVEPLKISFDKSSDGPLDGEDEKVDNLNSNVISLEDEQDEIISGSVVSDGLEEKDQNAHEVHDREKDVVTEINVDRTEDIEDVNLVCEGNDASGDVNVEDNEERTNETEPEEGQAPMKFGLDNNDACTGDERKSSEVTTGSVPTNSEGLASSDHDLMEFMTDNLENLKEPSKLDLEEPIGTLSEMGKEEHIEENAGVANIVNEVMEQVNRPKRKVGKKKVIKKRIMVQKSVTDLARESDNKPEEDEEPVKLGLDNNDAGTGDERKISEVTSEVMQANNEGLTFSDHGIMENMTDNLEDHEEHSKLDVDEPSGSLSDPSEEHINENTSPTKEAKEVIGHVNQPKRKLVKKKVVKKKMVQKPAAALNEEMPQPSNVNNASGETCKPDSNEHVTNEDPSDEACKADKSEHEEGAEVKPPVKVNRKRKLIRKKKVPQGDSGIATAKDSPKPQSEPRIEKHINEPGVKIGEVENSGDRVNLLKRCKKKKVAKKGFQEGVPKDVTEPKLSKESKAKRIDSMGMIFMCSSETKKDCYRYKVLGLPAGKKDMVLKIYKGMRLFLFDLDLRMLYGVYKAAGPGGYNLEPRAFKSQFPSQVRFSILEDCVPLAEERFKKVLKANYYTKNKFNCQLNSVQVKNLCKLFHETNKKAESQIVSGSRRPAATSSSARHDKKRKRVEDSRRGQAPVERESSRRRAQKEIRRAPVVVDDRSRHRAREEIRYAPMVIDDRSRRRALVETRHAHVIIDERSRRRDQEILRHVPVVIDDISRRRAQEEFRHAPVVIDDRGLRRAQEEIRHAPVVVDDRYHGLPVYERETYLSSVAPATSFQSLPAHSPRSRMYSFDRAMGVDPYRRDSVLDHRDVSLSSSREPRLPVGQSHLDPYVSYREPHVYSGSVYSIDTRRDHYDSSSDGRYAEYFRPAEHRPPPPLYRRY